MDLNSEKNRVLLRNCLVVKRKQLELDKDNQSTKALEYYSNLLELLKTDDTETLIAMLKSSNFPEDFLQFNNHILYNSEKDIAEEHVNIAKSLMQENNVYSQEKFEELKTAFYKGNEHLNPDNIKTKNPNEFEEETEKDPLLDLPNSIKSPLMDLRSLVKQPHTKNMSPEEFKNWAAKFRDCTKTFAKNKFQEYFTENRQSITDMQISYDNSNPEQKFYKLDFSLIDNAAQESTFALTEPVSISRFASSYFQNLCHSYLEANKFAEADSYLINKTSIPEILNDFAECYEKLQSMGKNKINIAKGKLIYSNYSSYSPSNELENIDCDKKPEQNERY